MKKKILHHKIKLIIILIIVLGLAMVGGLWTIRSRPSIGAYGADLLRKVIGNQAVVQLETLLFSMQDHLQQLEYKMGLRKPANPWSSIPRSTSISTNNPNPENDGGIPNQSLADLTQVVPTDGLSNIPTMTELPGVKGSIYSTPTPTQIGDQGPLTPPLQENNCALNAVDDPAQPCLVNENQPHEKIAWPPVIIQPLGDVEGEGIWQPYLFSRDKRVVAYRTFVVPDPERPYVVVAVVAFDMDYTRFHYVIGFQDPYDSDAIQRTKGIIPSNHLKEGILLAAFNGGFKYEHGKFGSMADGLVSVQPKDNLATMSIYKDGRIQIGAWGIEVKPTDDLLAYRQDGPLVIQDGVVATQVNDPKYWGYTLTGGTVTWRSGLATDSQGKILYYFAGPDLSIQSLATAMASVKPQMAMQLDINNYWVHFVKILTENGKLIAEPLFPGKVMSDRVDRYLMPYSRDFFYITALDQ